MTRQLMLDGENADGQLELVTSELVDSLRQIGVGVGCGVEFEGTNPVVCAAVAEATERLDAPLVLRRKGPWPRFGAYEVRARVLDLDGRPAVLPCPRDGRPPFPADARVVLWTSGSSGEPKAVLLSRAAVEHQARATCSRLEYERADRLALPLPLHHAYGFGVLQAWRRSDATLLLRSAFDVTALVADLLTGGVTSVDSVPSVYALVGAMARRDGRIRKRVSALRLRGCGGDLLGEELARTYLEELDAPLHDGYGLTEAGPNVALSSPSVYRKGTVGTPIEGVRVRTDPAIGEIQVNSPSVMTEYCGDAIATVAAFTADGWLRTGDVGTLGADGHLSVNRRIKDSLIVHGESFPPAVVEHVVLGSTLVESTVVVGIPSGNARGDRIIAFVQLDAMTAIEDIEADLRTRCRAELPVHLRPREVVRIARWPYLPSGKVDRRALREHASAIVLSRDRRASWLRSELHTMEDS